ncbi:MAG TPA: NUDIX domain-containing protein [Roseiflexaceae bacterium]|jgi:8-oxo-dGTP pyrophosphatase MutT (NUDIX family)|nr:NUDIX domain-containing protein [Roseiflexaceae bacterium]
MIVNVEAAVARHGCFLMIVRGANEAHAAGALSMPGGKVEAAAALDDVLEETARREVLEEIGLALDSPMHYVESHMFVLDDGTPVVDVVLLCRAPDGEPRIGSVDEVAAFHWMTAADVARHPRAAPWTVRSIVMAEEKRLACGW